MKNNNYIVGSGGYLPKKILTNYDLSKKIDTTDEWIAFEAAKRAIKNSKIKASNIDLIIVATSTPDNTFPSTATKVQAKLGIKKGFAFDIQAACTGFIYALSIADNYLSNNQATFALVIGSEIFSRILDWKDRSTCVLFGDGAGAIILGKQKKK